MGRESNDTIIIQSSIALLQERFRELQRVKEMREERELNKVLIQPKLFDTPMHYKLSPSNSRLFFHFLPPRSSSSLSATPTSQVSLNLWSNSQGKDADFQCLESPISTPLRSNQTSSMYASSEKFDECKCDDVDTSLHL
ncbi:hypothetical protein Pint_09473 [Pistacia integerrima]|uniref:Uncharacterized protein n=1 Tax=Pistacia integerrima TaxID=434235 RepID=A0ACC0XE89_9ROSI|nr:hypothetical protein Pint_09473 [Pistacia integerrima]